MCGYWNIRVYFLASYTTICSVCTCTRDDSLPMHTISPHIPAYILHVLKNLYIYRYFSWRFSLFPIPHNSDDDDGVYAFYALRTLHFISHAIYVFVLGPVWMCDARRRSFHLIFQLFSFSIVVLFRIFTFFFLLIFRLAHTHIRFLAISRLCSLFLYRFWYLSVKLATDACICLGRHI